MGNLTDELLMAYADGELDDEKSKKVEGMLARDQASRERLAVFQSTGRGLSDLYDKPMREPVPSHLIEFVKRSGAASGRASTRAIPARRKTGFSRLFGVGEGLVGRLVFNPFSFSLAAAMAVAALIIVGSNKQFTGLQIDEPEAKLSNVAMSAGGVLTNGAAHSVLETGLSGIPVALTSSSNSGRSLKSVFSFKDHDGRYCRQYEVWSEAVKSHVGVGCRNHKGHWQILIHVPNKGGGGSTSDYQTASGGQEARVEEMVDNLIDSDVLDLEREAALISNSWRSNEN